MDQTIQFLKFTVHLSYSSHNKSCFYRRIPTWIFPERRFQLSIWSLFYWIKTSHFDCRRFNKYWNPKRDTIGQLIFFLKFSLNAFSFRENITWANITWACGISAFLIVLFYRIFLYGSILFLFFIFLFLLVLFNVITK